MTIAEATCGILIGFTLELSIKIIEHYKLPHRVIKEDGNAFVGTRDFNIHRINLTVEKGLVTEATLG